MSILSIRNSRLPTLEALFSLKIESGPCLLSLFTAAEIRDKEKKAIEKIEPKQAPVFQVFVIHAGR